MNSIKEKYGYLMALWLVCSCLQAQTIQLEFPYFAGKTYEFKIVQGEKHIVLRNDTIPKGGKIELSIPEQYKGYKGMSMWYLTNSATGGGLEMVINNENFSVSCLEPVPTAENIIYKNTLENTFAPKNYEKQQDILAKHDAMLTAKRAYGAKDKLYPLFDKEYERSLKNYSHFVKELKSSPLYAARFREITNITLGIGTTLTLDEKIKAENINDLIVNQIDYADLYTSNHWGGIINSFIQLQTVLLKNDDRLLADVRTILGRLPSNQIYTDFVVSLTKELTKVGKDTVLKALTPEIKNANRLLNFEGVLSLYKNDITGKVPDLLVAENTAVAANTKTTTIDLAKQKNKYTLIVFHRSGCEPCEELIQGLKDNYKVITSKGITLLSIAGDTDKALFDTNAVTFPWSQKYFDAQGTNGVNFKNYAVIGTPTLFMVDENGFLVKKMYGMIDLLAWIHK